MLDKNMGDVREAEEYKTEMCPALSVANSDSSRVRSHFLWVKHQSYNKGDKIEGDIPNFWRFLPLETA